MEKLKKIKKKTTLSSRQACFMISHSSGDFNDKNIYNHHLYTKKIYIITVAENLKFKI